MMREVIFKIKLVALVSFAVIFLACFVPDRYLGNCIIPLRNTYFVLTLASFCFLFILISLVKNIQLPTKFNAQDICITIFFLYIFINYLFKDGLINDLFISFVCLLAFYFAVKLTFQASGDLLKKAIVTIFLLMGFFQGIYGLLQMAGIIQSRNEIFTVTGSFFNPAPYAIHLVSFLPFSLSIFFFIDGDNLLHRVMKYLAIANVLILVAVLPVTESRTAWMAGVAGAIVVLFVRYNLKQAIIVWLGTVRNKIIAFLLVIGILFAGVWMYKFKENSALGRLFIWKVACGMVYKNPVTGTGFNGVRAHYNDIQAEYFKKHPGNFEEIKTANQVNYVFNDYLQILIEEGVAGLLLFLALMIITVYAAIKILSNAEQKPLSKSLIIGSFSGLISLMVTFFTTYTLESLPATLNLFFFIGLISAFSTVQYTLPERSPIIKYPGYLVSVGLAIISVVLLVREFKSVRSYLQVTAYHSAVDRLTLFQNNYDKLKNDPAYTLRYGKLLAESGKHEESIAMLNSTASYLCDTSLYRSLGDSHTVLGNREAAEKFYLKAITIAPQRFRPRYNMVNFYLKEGDTLKALSMAKYIVDMPVRVRSEVVIRIQEEMQKLLAEDHAKAGYK